MRLEILCTLVLLGLPQVAVAAGAAAPGDGQDAARGAAVSARNDAPVADLPPTLDLQVLPTQLPARTGAARASGLDRGARPSQAGAQAAEDPLSFGLEIRRPPELEGPLRQSEDDAPGLRDDLERLIEHSTLGVRGTYRF